MAEEKYSIVNDNGEVVAEEVQISPLSETEAMTVGDLSDFPVESEEKAKIPPILIKGAIVAGSYAAYKGAKKGIAWVRAKMAESKQAKTEGLTPEQLEVAKQAYLTLHNQGLSDTAILYEAECSAKMYEDSEEEKKE